MTVSEEVDIFLYSINSDAQPEIVKYSRRLVEQRIAIVKEMPNETVALAKLQNAKQVFDDLLAKIPPEQGGEWVETPAPAEPTSPTP